MYDISFLQLELFKVISAKKKSSEDYAGFGDILRWVKIKSTNN